MREGEGLFVVLEGIDGSGTTTQAERLVEWLKSERRLVHVTREPTSGPVGSLLRLVLTHRLTLSGPRRAATMALLFAADRLDHVDSEIDPYLRDGYVVISDRYDLSSLVYQSVLLESEGMSPEEAIAFVRQVNRFARRPDLTLVLGVRPDVAAARRRKRGGPIELFEDADLQVRLAAEYLEPRKFVGDDRVTVLDGNLEPPAVAEAIRTALAGALAEGERARTDNAGDNR